MSGPQRKNRDPQPGQLSKQDQLLALTAQVLRATNGLLCWSILQNPDPEKLAKMRELGFLGEEDIGNLS